MSSKTHHPTNQPEAAQSNKQQPTSKIKQPPTPTNKTTILTEHKSPNPTTKQHYQLNATHKHPQKHQNQKHQIKSNKT